MSRIDAFLLGAAVAALLTEAFLFVLWGVVLLRHPFNADAWAELGWCAARMGLLMAVIWWILPRRAAS